MSNMKKDVMILTGAGQIGMAIARRIGYGKKIVVGDLNPESTEAVCGGRITESGFHRNDSESRSVRNGCPARRSWEGY